MNEGHSAFLSLERMQGLMQKYNLDFGSAYEAATSSMCFTTHTPVPAGNDMFPEDLVQKYLEPLIRGPGAGLGALCLTRPRSRDAGRQDLLHAGRRPAHLDLRQRRQPAARAGLARDVAADLA